MNIRLFGEGIVDLAGPKNTIEKDIIRMAHFATCLNYDHLVGEETAVGNIMMSLIHYCELAGLDLEACTLDVYKDIGGQIDG